MRAGLHPTMRLKVDEGGDELLDLPPRPLGSLEIMFFAIFCFWFACIDTCEMNGEALVISMI